MMIANVMDFAEARAAELHAVASLLDDDDRRSGLVPRRRARLERRLLRRRTGSRVVWRFRTRRRLEHAVAVSARGRSRRDLRRASALRAKASARGGLATEAWHAKRFEMRLCFGIRLPWRARDRGARSAVRAANEYCVLHDASYLRPLLLHGEPAALTELLAGLTDASADALGRLLGAPRELCCTLHWWRRWPSATIAPVRLLPCAAAANGGRRAVWVFVHEAAALQARSALEHAIGLALAARAADAAGAPPALALGASTLPVVRFQLRGPQSHALLRRALALAPGAAAEAAWRALAPLASPAALPPRAILGVDALHPHAAPTPAPPPTSASPHRRRAPPPPPPPPQPAAADAAAEARALRSLLLRWPAHLAASPLYGRVDDAAAGGALPLLLVQEPPAALDGGGALRGGFGSGWDIIAPRHAARALWAALVLAGGRAIGQLELRAIALHEERPLFPYDAPDTLAGSHHAAADGADRRNAHARRPPSRRPNYAKLGVAQPFACDWPSLLGLPPPPDAAAAAPAADTAAGADAAAPAAAVSGEGWWPQPPFCVLRGAAVATAFAKRREGGAAAPALPPSLASQLPSALLRVVLVMGGRGHPQPLAAIHAPTAAEVARWRADRRWGGAQLPAGRRAVAPGDAQIGCVSAGGYHALHGGGFAVGYCAAAPLLERFGSDANLSGTPAGPLLVLVRNVTSRQFRPALLSVRG